MAHLHHLIDGQAVVDSPYKPKFEFISDWLIFHSDKAVHQHWLFLNLYLASPDIVLGVAVTQQYAKASESILHLVLMNQTTGHRIHC